MTDQDLLTAPLTFREDLLKDQVVLVSGAGSGLGKAIAIQCARLGAKVAICGRRIERLEVTAELIRSIGAEVMVRAATIRDAEDVDRLHGEVWDRFGRVDHLVNNAGGQFPQAAIDYSVKGWNAVIDTNLNGPWYMMQAAAKRWRDAKMPGSIINIVTVIWRGMPGVAHTCAARAGVVYLSKTLAIEWAPLAIRVNCVAPGAIATEGMDVYSEEAQRDLPRSNLMQRYGQARDVADAVTYLAGPSGAFVTGEVMVVDGGNQVWGDQWTIPRPDYFKRAD
ncbi:SDR family oxidoreductase [Phreatobacter aquaticus]|uniref:Peroxisomal trans-2-enoyl-CoA reductase n=1 Tax=Phreatobacter aquaticus TaxID=2570229 RepID=A0A4D7QMQ2_9HYPH|nr:SDR family oxidoreductase [Phreatobacter aquaticus]QCK87791.1 SDR family oxidoreductase [Phreatobacter aquaticus]